MGVLTSTQIPYANHIAHLQLCNIGLKIGTIDRMNYGVEGLTTVQMDGGVGRYITRHAYKWAFVGPSPFA